MEAPDYWNDAEAAQESMRTLKSLKDDKAAYEQLVSGYEDMQTLIEMGYEENDPELLPCMCIALYDLPLS